MLTVKNLSKRFCVHILNDTIIEGFNTVNFSVGEGKALGVSGPSGAGKSSILKCIYRRYIPSSGDIFYESNQFGNVNMTDAADKIVLKIRENEIGYITQFLRVIPRVPCVDVVAEPLMLAGVHAGEARDRAGSLLDRLGIPARLFNAYPSTFSGGEQQRVNIARAIIRGHRLLMLDEPTASLDSRSTAVVLEIFYELKKSGTTMIGVFHDSGVLADFADDIYKLGV